MLRLYLTQTLQKDTAVSLNEKQTHYAVNVRRLEDGDEVVAFNGVDGEWLCVFKKISKQAYALNPIEKIKEPLILPKLGLAFAPIKSERLFFLIEKAVELGVTDLFPIQTDFTQGIRFSEEKTLDQMIGATQQCERTCPPILHPLQKMNVLINQLKGKWTLYGALERHAPMIYKENKTISTSPPCLFVGPEGGWSAGERAFFEATRDIESLSLGTLILRSETAAVVGLTLLKTLHT